MRLIKCDMCGHVENVDDGHFMEVRLAFSKTGYQFTSYEVCGDCANDLIKILTAGVDTKNSTVINKAMQTLCGRKEE